MLGHHELDYPRNILSQRLIRGAGYEVVLVHSRAPGPLREVALLRGCLDHAWDVDAIFVTEGAHRHVPLIKAVARMARRPLIFDPFTSRYNTYVEDRGLYSPRSMQALRCWWLDWSSTRSADHCIFDTYEHLQYFHRRYGRGGPSHIIEVGVDEADFRPLPPPVSAGSLRVLFYGTYIPLQGVEHIVEAAALLRHEPDIRFTLVGRGQTRGAVEHRLAALGLSNVTLGEPVSQKQLVEHMRESDVCLGIFGTTEKAGNVVPNKVVQAAAVGRPLITGRSPAVERYFVHARDALLVEPGDPRSLADALLSLRDRPALRIDLARAGREVFERHFSERALTEKMRRVLDAAIGGSPGA